MAIWTKTSLDDVVHTPTHLEILEALKPGDWLFFSSNIYEYDNQYIKIVEVQHTPEALEFTYCKLDAYANDTPDCYQVLRNRINDSGEISMAFIVGTERDELVNYINRQIDNVGIELWRELRDQ